MTKHLFKDGKVNYINIVLLTILSSVFFAYLSLLMSDLYFLVSLEAFLYQSSHALLIILVLIHLYFHTRFMIDHYDIKLQIKLFKETKVVVRYISTRKSYSKRVFIRYMVLRI